MTSWKECVTVPNINKLIFLEQNPEEYWPYFGFLGDGKGSTTPGWFLYFLGKYGYIFFSVFTDLISSIEPNKMSNVVYT